MVNKNINEEIRQLNESYSNLQSFIFNRNFNQAKGTTFQVEMIFVDNVQNNNKLLIKFENVKNLKVENLTAEYLPHDCIICVKDISQNQWEGLNFEVFDSEEELFSFYCGEFSYIRM
jgi:hypothetical protein